MQGAQEFELPYVELTEEPILANINYKYNTTKNIFSTWHKKLEMP